MYKDMTTASAVFSVRLPIFRSKWMPPDAYDEMFYDRFGHKFVHELMILHEEHREKTNLKVIHISGRIFLVFHIIVHIIHNRGA